MVKISQHKIHPYKKIYAQIESSRQADMKYAVYIIFEAILILLSCLEVIFKKGKNCHWGIKLFDFNDC